MTDPNLRTVFAAAFRDAERTLARVTWSRQMMAELARVQQLVDAAWDRRLAEDSDTDDDTPPPEQAHLDRLLAEINAAVDHDRWPRHLYWNAV